MKRYTGAIFDMDGVLFDTECVFQQTWEELAAERGLTLPVEFTEAISGTNGAVMCRVIERFFGVPDGLEIMTSCRARVRDKLSREVPVKPGAREILAYLRGAGLRIAVASSSSRAQIESNLNLSGLRPYIDAILSGEEVTTGKPDPEIFLRTAAAIQCEPEACFVFEDSMSGVYAGHAAGCATVMVPDLLPPTPDVVPLCFLISDSLNAALVEIARILESED